MAETRCRFIVSVLGPLAVERQDRRIDLGPAKQQAVFAMLALKDGQSVPAAAIGSAVWGAGAAANARSLLHTYIARLRQVLEPDRGPRRRESVIASTATGYHLRSDNVDTDLGRFRALADGAHAREAAGDQPGAFDLLGSALAVWRDPALDELRSLLPDYVEVETLRAEWVSAARAYVGLGLRLRRPGAVLGIATRLARLEPLHEAAQAEYLTVLAGVGRRAEALERYSEVTTRLRAELGVVPGPHLRAVRRTLSHPPRRPPVPRPAPPPVAYESPRQRPLPHRLFGRREDLATLVDLVRHKRAVTVTGPPGCGISALVLGAAARATAFCSGVVVVDTLDLSDRRQLERRMARMLGGDGSEDPAELLRGRRRLVVLDNAEHLVDACALVAGRLLNLCPDVRVLVGSRQPLGLWCEEVLRIAPLPAPVGDDVRGNPAVELLTDRARLHRPGFAAGRPEELAEICRRLDGLPLALAMAAGRLAADGPGAVLRDLDGGLGDLRQVPGPLPVRYPTLRAAIDRSVERLDVAERWLFRRVGMLPETFDVEAARRLWQPHPYGPTDVTVVLSALADKSLLQPVGSDGCSYRMLGLLRRWAVESVALGEDPWAGPVPVRLPVVVEECLRA